MAQQQQTRAMLVIIDPEDGRLEFTARPTNTRGLALVNLCYDAIADYQERQRVLEAVANSAAGQYQQIEQARVKAQEQRSAAKEAVVIMMHTISEHFWMEPDNTIETDNDTTAVTEGPSHEPAVDFDPDGSTASHGHESDNLPDESGVSADPSASGQVQDLPKRERVDIATVTTRKQSRLLSKPIPWITITISRDLAQNRPTEYGKAMTQMLKDATTMLESHDAIAKPQKRRSSKNAAPTEPSPDQLIADGLMDTAEQTLATFVTKALTANW